MYRRHKGPLLGAAMASGRSSVHSRWVMDVLRITVDVGFHEIAMEVTGCLLAWFISM